jgi:acyl carrier protein
MEERIKEIMAAVFEVDRSEIDENTASGDLEKWDSLHHMNLISALEEEFEIELEEEEIMEMMNFKLIRLVLSEKIRG